MCIEVLIRECGSTLYVGLTRTAPPTNASKDLILVHAVQLQPTVKVQISGRMASIGIKVML